MASPHHLHLLLLILLLTKHHTSARTINTNSSSAHNKLHGGEFLVHPLWAGTLISFSAGFSLGTIAFLIWRLYKSRCAEPEAAVELSSSKPTLFSPVIHSIDDLSFLQTLHQAGHPLTLEVIGRGGCGEVYKAEIFTGDRLIPIAIKKVVQPWVDAAHLCEEDSKLLSRRMRQVRAEIVTVGRMRHPNLLRLLAHVPRPDCHYLVYEFMKEGSLHDVLRREPRKLRWPSRVRIAVGIAAGLEYIHMVHRPRVIHRDLKPANVLLDSDMNARIGDFGLAKVLTIDTMSRTMTSSKVAGTVGYIAPEYYQTMTCSDKCDVYSFGVILAVLVTGRFPNDRFFQMTEELCLMGWVRSVMSSEEPTAVIDPMLVGDGFETEMLLVLKIACFCTYEDPKERPNSRDVRCMLAQIGNRTLK